MTPRDNAIGRTGDFEDRLTSRDHNSLRVWLRLMSVHKLIAGSIRQRFQEKFAITFPRFDLMAQLQREPDGLRMVDLSARLMVTNGNITQITDQLEREGLVERHPDPSSRRACRVKLSLVGRQTFAPIAAAHEEWVVELLSGLSQREKAALLSLLAKEKTFLVGAAAVADSKNRGKKRARGQSPKKRGARSKS